MEDNNIFWREVENESIFETKEAFYLYTETYEINIGHFHSLFFVFAVNEVFFDKFLWLHNKTRNVNSFFRYIVKTTSLNVKVEQQIQRRLAKINQTLIWSCAIYITDMVKDQFWSFLFLKVNYFFLLHLAGR